MEIGTERWFRVADAESRQVLSRDTHYKAPWRGSALLLRLGALSIFLLASLRHYSVIRHYSCWPPALQQQQEVRTWQLPFLKQSPSKALGRSEKKRGASLAPNFPREWYWGSRFPPSTCRELYLICSLPQRFLLQPCFLFFLALLSQYEDWYVCWWRWKATSPLASLK